VFDQMTNDREQFSNAARMYGDELLVERVEIVPTGVAATSRAR
jgi:hypothetical protein